MNCVKPLIGEFHNVIDSLAECRTPLLIGVRHHSAALARTIETLLHRFQPECVLVEMPSDFNPWLEYLADEQTVAPVAISAVDAEGSLGFYPLADFSPEWVAVRWATRHGIQVVPCDLSVSARWRDFDANQTDDQVPPISQYQGLLDSLMRRTHSTDTGQLWERLIESPAMMIDAEEVRRAGLLFGWAVRANSDFVPRRDLLREAAMRQAIRAGAMPAEAPDLASLGVELEQLVVLQGHQQAAIGTHGERHGPVG